MVRLKSYSAASGYVYEYYFRGQNGAEYRFDVSADRKTFSPVYVRLDPAAVARAAGRELSSVEEYAVAKMSLFAAFDERPDWASLADPVTPDEAAYRDVLRTLDLV